MVYMINWDIGRFSVVLYPRIPMRLTMYLPEDFRMSGWVFRINIKFFNGLLQFDGEA